MQKKFKNVGKANKGT